MIRLLFTVTAVTLVSVGLQAGSLLAASPGMSASRTSGPIGAPVALNGSGFVSGETVYVEIVRVGAPEGTPIGKVIADASGSFTAIFTVGIAYPGPEYPLNAPVGGGQSINFPPGSYVIMAYPDSFGLRTQESLAQAPKVPFQVTAGLPETGGPPAPGHDSIVVPLAAAVLLLMFSLAAFSFASRSE